MSDFVSNRFFFLINFSEIAWKVGTVDASAMTTFSLLDFFPLTPSVLLANLATATFLIGIKLVTFT